MSCMFVVLMLAAGVSAQAPTNSLERAIKELQAEIEHTRAEVKALRVSQEKEAARQRASESRRSARQKAVEVQAQKPPKPAVKKNDVVEIRISQGEQSLKQAELILAELDSGMVPKSQIPTEQKKVIAALVIERNAIREKIRRQNNKRQCRWFGIGCVSKK